jgi:hypothetical protein
MIDKTWGSRSVRKNNMARLVTANIFVQPASPYIYNWGESAARKIIITRNFMTSIIKGRENIVGPRASSVCWAA